MDILKRDEGFHTLIVGVINGCQKLQRLCFAELIPVPRHSNLINLYFVFFFVCRLMVVLVSRRYETMLFA